MSDISAQWPSFNQVVNMLLVIATVLMAGFTWAMSKTAQDTLVLQSQVAREQNQENESRRQHEQRLLAPRLNFPTRYSSIQLEPADDRFQIAEQVYGPVGIGDLEPAIQNYGFGPAIDITASYCVTAIDGKELEAVPEWHDIAGLRPASLGPNTLSYCIFYPEELRQVKKRTYVKGVITLSCKDMTGDDHSWKFSYTMSFNPIPNPRLVFSATQVRKLDHSKGW